MMTNLKEELEALAAKANDEDLATEGHYWKDSLSNLTSCSHGDCGYFANDANGELIAALWNAYRAGQLDVIEPKGQGPIIGIALAQFACEPVFYELLIHYANGIETSLTVERNAFTLFTADLINLFHQPDKKDARITELEGALQAMRWAFDSPIARRKIGGACADEARDLMRTALLREGE
ncbi:MAG: hypothetical protein OIF56_14835 [Cohaesibacter sp.]|nr:hypothetical protein [Cohaesibacter sp.]